MKLGELLIVRANILKRLPALRERLVANAKYQEGDATAEDPRVLREELERLIVMQERLNTHIHTVNAESRIGAQTVTQLLARQDAWKLRIRIFTDFLHKTDTRHVTWRTKDDPVYVSTTDVLRLQRRIEKLQKDLNKLELILQEANWSIETSFDINDNFL